MVFTEKMGGGAAKGIGLVTRIPQGVGHSALALLELDTFPNLGESTQV